MIYNKESEWEGFAMDYEGFIKQGLDGEAPLKLILCGNVEDKDNDKVGVVSVVYATEDRALAQQKIRELAEANPENYYMVYSVPLNVDLTGLDHYPSIEISKSDLQ